MRLPHNRRVLRRHDSIIAGSGTRANDSKSLHGHDGVSVTHHSSSATAPGVHRAPAWHVGLRQAAAGSPPRDGAPRRRPDNGNGEHHSIGWHLITTHSLRRCRATIFKSSRPSTHAAWSSTGGFSPRRCHERRPPHVYRLSEASCEVPAMWQVPAAPAPRTSAAQFSMFKTARSRRPLGVR